MFRGVSARLTRAGLIGLLFGVAALAIMVAKSEGFSGTTVLVSGFADTRFPFVTNLYRRWTGRGVATMIVSQPDVRILFAGDLMLDRTVADRTRASRDPMYPFKKLPVGWVESFDYAVVNLEGPVTAKREPPVKTIDFAFDPAWAPRLKALGFDAVSQANNHSLDQGRTGYDASMKTLREAGLLAFGDQVRDGDVAFASTTVNGLRVGFLGYNITDNALDQEAASTTIAQVRTTVDRLIVFIHWGEEYQPEPTAAVRQTAEWFIDRGVDAVVGAHPHWSQGVSSYKGKPIVWSLGNFVFDQDWSDETRQGLAVAFTFSTATTTLELFPLSILQSQPALLGGDTRTKRLEVLAARSDAALGDAVRTGTVPFSFKR